jgi:hypothetical protein
MIEVMGPEDPREDPSMMKKGVEATVAVEDTTPADTTPVVTAASEVDAVAVAATHKEISMVVAEEDVVVEATAELLATVVIRTVAVAVILPTAAVVSLRMAVAAADIAAALARTSLDSMATCALILALKKSCFSRMRLRRLVSTSTSTTIFLLK